VGDKAAAFQFLVKIAGWDGYFVSRTGGETSAPVTKVYDGGAEFPETVAGRKDVSNIVCGRHFDPNRDGPIRAQFKNQVGRFRTTVSVTPTDENFIPTGPADVYPDALLSRFGPPTADAESNDPSRYEVEFTVTQVA